MRTDPASSAFQFSTLVATGSLRLESSGVHHSRNSFIEQIEQLYLPAPPGDEWQNDGPHLRWAAEAIILGLSDFGDTRRTASIRTNADLEQVGRFGCEVNVAGVSGIFDTALTTRRATARWGAKILGTSPQLLCAHRGGGTAACTWRSRRALQPNFARGLRQ